MQTVDLADLLAVASAGHLFAVVDACVVEDVLALVVARGPESGACLYMGSAASNYGDKAPYLLKADIEFLATLAARYADEPWGCLVSSPDGFTKVRQHLRSLLKVDSPDGDTWIFRFYDPRILPTFLAGSTAAELDAFFGPLVTFVTIDAAGTAHANFRKYASPPPRRKVGERYRLSSNQVGALRRGGMADRLAESFEGSSQAATRNGEGTEVRVADPYGNVIRLGLGADGFVDTVDSPLGRRWRVASRDDGKPSMLTMPSGRSVGLEYDGHGNIARVSRDGRETFTANHDQHGRIGRIAFPDGTHSHTTYLDEGRAGIVDPGGVRIVARTDRNGHADRFDYVGGAPSSAADGAGNRSAFAWHSNDQLSETTFADGSRETYRFDPLGRLAQLVRSDGSSLDVVCDAAGRLLSIKAADGQTSTFAYDGAGRLVLARNAQSSVSWRYDDAGRPVEERQGGDRVAYEYDGAGTLVGLTYPTGETICYGRDADLRISSITDWSGRSYAFEYAPGDAGWLMTAPGGARTTVWQNPTGLMTASRAEIDGETLFENVFAFDDEDRLTDRRDTRLGEARYGYDAEGQVRSVAFTGQVDEAFSYDGAGNRIRVGEVDASFNALNQLVAQGETRCSYDGRGNLADRHDPSGSWRYTYDGFDRLVRAEHESGRSASYGYDALGRRIRKEVRDGRGHETPLITTSYVWAGEQMIREVTRGAISDAFEVGTRSNGARDFLYWPQRDTPLLLRDGDDVYLYHTDPAGVPVRLTNRLGVIVWEAVHGAFGAASETVTKIRQPWRLPGQYFDDETGLHYNRFRYYDPVLGRFISRDPIGYAGGLNLYQYVGNDPINRADPLGLWWKTALTVLAAVAVGALVVLTAPISGPLLLVAAGAAAGATAFGLNEALNQEQFCASCIAWAALKGAGVGALTAVPFLFLPTAAGVGAFAAAGAGSGFLNYAGTYAVTPGMPWSWRDAAISTGIGAGTAGIGRYAGLRWQGRNAPPTEPYNRLKHYGRTPTAADRRAVGAGPGQVADHDPPLSQRYYDGDPKIGEKPGHRMTPQERTASAQDRSRMSPQSKTDSDAQGGRMSKYSRDQKKKYGL